MCICVPSVPHSLSELGWKLAPNLQNVKVKFYPRVCENKKQLRSSINQFPTKGRYFLPACEDSGLAFP